MQNSKQDLSSHSKRLSLNHPQNLENCLNSGNIGKIKRRASKIVTLLPENSLTPIPKKEGINKLGMANGYGKKELKNAERTAVFIRRMEYATSMKRQMGDVKGMKSQAKKIALIQEWWKTMFKIIKLQKNVRGFLFRKKLMSNLEHQEKLLQFITEFDNIHNYYLYKNFMDKLKEKRDYEKAKLMEKCEDFSEKLDNLEKMQDLKNLKKYLDIWRNDAREKKKQDLENLVKKLNDILSDRIKKNKLDAFNAIKDKGKSEEDKLNNKIKEFQEKMAKQNFMRDLIRAHRLNKFLNNAKNKIDDRLKKEALDKLKKNKGIAAATEKLQKLLDNNLKKKTWNDLKTMDFVQIVDDVINYHNDKVNDDAKRELLEKLRDISDRLILRDNLKKWKDFNDEMKNRNKIIHKLIRHKQNELKKKAEEEKNKFCISSGVNDFEVVSDKKQEPRRHRNSQIFISMPNDINILAKPSQKIEFQTVGQNFSLIAPEIIKFNFESPQNKMPKIDINLIENQLKDLQSFRNKNNLKKHFNEWKEIANKKDILDKLKDRMNDLLKKKKEKEDKFKQILDYIQNIKDNNDLREYFNRWRDAAKKMKQDSLNNLANKLNDILTKAKKESEDKLKKDLLDKLKKNNDIAVAVERLEYLMNIKPKKDILDTLKKNAGVSEGFRVLDKLFKEKGNDLEKEAMNKIKQNADTIMALEDLNELLNHKLKEKLLNNLRRNAQSIKALNNLLKLLQEHLHQKLLDELRRRNDLYKSLRKLNEIISNNVKKDTFDDLKQRYKIGKGTSKLEELIINKLESKFMDILKRERDYDIASEIIHKIINNQLKKDAFNTLKKNNNISKAVDMLDKLFKDIDNRLKKEVFDTFKKNNNIGKAVEILDKLIKNKLKQDALDTLKKNYNICKAVDILDKIFKDNDNKIKKDVFDTLKKNNNIGKAVEMLNKLIENKLKKDALDTLEKNNNICKAIDMLDKLFKDIDNRLKKNILDTLKKNKNIGKGVDILDKLFENKLKRDALDTLKNNNNISKAIDILDKLFKDNDNKLKKDVLDTLKKNNNIGKAVEMLDKLFENKLKKDALDTLKKNNNISKAIDILDKLFKDNDNKLKKDVLDTLKINNNIGKAIEMLNKLIDNKLKKDALDTLKKNYNISKAVDTLDKIFKDNNNKLKKEVFDTLKKNNNISRAIDILDKLFKDNDNKLKREVFDLLKSLSDIAKASDILEHLMNNKLKEDAFKKLKTNQFVDILDKMIKNNKDKNKQEKQRRLVDNLIKIRNASEAKDKQDLRSAFDKWKLYRESNEIFQKIKNLKKKIYLHKLKTACDRAIFFDKFRDFINKKKLKKYLDIWKDIANRRKIKDALVNKSRKKKAIDHWRSIKELRDILDKLKQNKKKELLVKCFRNWVDNCEFMDIVDKLNDLSNHKKLKNYFDKWYDTANKINIFEKLNNYLLKKKALNDWKENVHRQNILRNTRRNKILENIITNAEENLLKKYFNRWKENAKKLVEHSSKSKRISYRSSAKKPKYKKTNERKLLKQTFGIWKENSSFDHMKDVLDKIKKNKLDQDKLNDKDDIIDKYKSKMMQALLNIYKKQENMILGKYFYIWRIETCIGDGTEVQRPKYKKKKRFEDIDFNNNEPEVFNPTYINPKQNVYNKNNFTYHKKIIPKPEEFNYDDIEEEEENDDQYSDSSSNNEANVEGGEVLKQVKKVVISQARNYTSQSFFINKNVDNSSPNNNNNYQMTTHNTNQLPMTLKGDFISLIENNPKILAQKNPRIQVTNATCNLEQIIDNEYTESELNPEEVNYEMEKLDNNFVIDKSKVLTKVIENCDKDLYAAQKPFRVKKDQWYSVSIPLNDNEAKWEFLNNIKGERDKNNLNKFELIQNEKTSKKEEALNTDITPYSLRTFRSDRKRTDFKDTSYRLREMNYSQFYRSPMKSPRFTEDDKSVVSSQISMIKRPHRRKNTQTSFLNNSILWNTTLPKNINNYGSNNIDRSKGKIELDPRSRSIDFSDGYGQYDDSD